MARIVGSVQKDDLKARMRQARKVRYQKPLKVKLGPLLKAALEAERK